MLHIKLELWVYVFVCEKLENECTVMHQTWHAYFLRQRKYHRMVKTLEEGVLSFIPTESFCCS
jgi:hypothetical protein